MKLNYKIQVVLTLVVVLLGNTVGTLYGNWMLISGGFALAGLLWVVHPVMPEGMTKSSAFLLGIRLIGVLIIAFGTLKSPAVNAWVAQLLG